MQFFCLFLKVDLSPALMGRLILDRFLQDVSGEMRTYQYLCSFCYLWFNLFGFWLFQTTESSLFQSSPFTNKKHKLEVPTAYDPKVREKPSPVQMLLICSTFLLSSSTLLSIYLIVKQ